jgi:hypothetical protein
VAAEGWAEYADDVERTYRALTAPGVTTLVAIADGRVAGAIQIQSDGVIQANVPMLLIDGNWRGAGLSSRLVPEGLERSGGLQLDVRTRLDGYYRSRFGRAWLDPCVATESRTLLGSGGRPCQVEPRQ